MIKSVPLLALGAGGFFVAGSLLTWAITRLLRSNRKQIVASGPVTAEQEFRLPAAGEFLLVLEVPRFGSDHRAWQLEVLEQATGEVTRLRYDPIRAGGAVYGMGSMRVPYGRLRLARAGSYLVRVLGLEPGKNYSSSRVLISRPYLGRMILQIIGIVFSAILLLLSLLLLLWQVLPLQSA